MSSPRLVQPASCLVRELTSLRDVQSASWQSASWRIRELSSNPRILPITSAKKIRRKHPHFTRFKIRRSVFYRWPNTYQPLMSLALLASFSMTDQTKKACKNTLAQSPIFVSENASKFPKNQASYQHQQTVIIY